MSEATRIAALKAALELRTGASTPEEITLVAMQFDEFLAEPKGAASDGVDGQRPPVAPSKPEAQRKR